MDETTFHKLADETLENLSEALEDADDEGSLEVDFESGILNIETSRGKKYVINKHAAMKQIWMASPASGASHFSYKEGRWKTSDGRFFDEMMTSEMKNLGVEIEL